MKVIISKPDRVYQTDLDQQSNEGKKKISNVTRD